ncbi:hypothetical protein MOV75_16885, partial [Bradyrhizobium sp. PRIMUS42]|nr:hypothetical protein [Bradyrhizobium sp. PRIMUS42]
MRKLLAAAAFLLASTAAQAQYTFEYGGRTIRIDPDRGTVQIPGVYDNTGQGSLAVLPRPRHSRALSVMGPHALGVRRRICAHR